MDKTNNRDSNQITSIQSLENMQLTLNQEQQDLSSMIQLFPGGSFVYSADEDDQFVFISINLLLMLGYTKEEFEQKFENRFSLMIYHEDRARVLEEIRNQIAVRPFDTCSYRIEKKDGSLLWVHDEGHIVADKNGKKWFYVVVVDITSAVKAKEALTNQYNELHQIIDNVPASILVLKRDRDVFSAVAVNQYLCKTVGITASSIANMTMDKVWEFTHPDDRPEVRDFFWNIIAENEQSAEITYRIKTGQPDEYQWFHCNGVQVPQNDGTALIYVVYTDATYQKIQEGDFNRVIQELLKTNPNSLCAFRLNLSKNICSEAHSSSVYIRQLLDSSTADGLLENIASVITVKPEAQTFRKNFNRQRLMEKFSQGEEQLSTLYHRLVSENEVHLVTSFFHTLKNPYTGDIETIAYSVDSDETHKKSLFDQIVTDEEYDYIGLLNVATHKLKFFYVKADVDRKNMSNITHEDNLQWVLSSIPSAEERTQYLKSIQMEAIIAGLNQQSVYSISYFSMNEAGLKSRKQLRFRYLENDHKELMFSRSDVTATFEQEERNAEMLRQAALDAEKANELKSEFLGNVSHDMRTPLNAILGYNKLAMAADDSTDKDQYLKKLEIAGQTLLSLINDTLDLQKIENGTVILKPEPVGCQRIIEDVITAVKPMMEDKHITFVVDTSRTVIATILADPVRLRQIFINLISNAAKFTPAGGCVEVVLECLRNEDKRLDGKITVRDNGIGMSPDFIGKIYEPFSQERTASTAHIGGSGLGLSIVKRIVDLMGGRIEVKSELGKGSEFTVYLSFERQNDDNPGESQQEDTRTLAGLHFLLCEDNQMNMDIAKIILEMNDATVDCAVDGLQGYEMFVASQPGDYDVILMDIRMPVLDGYEAARQIRALAHPEAKTIPIIAMTADAYASDIEKSFAAGMNAHISKPIDFDILKNEVLKNIKEK